MGWGRGRHSLRVHQYGMQLMVGWCEKAFERSQLDLWPSDPIASSDVLNHPGLVQCLALADAKQCDSLVQSCLSQLIKPCSVAQNIHSALTSPHLDKLMDAWMVCALTPKTRSFASLSGCLSITRYDWPSM